MAILKPPLSRAPLLGGLAGLTTPWILGFLLGFVGGNEVGLVEWGYHRFNLSHAGVQFIFDAWVPLADAAICAAIYAVPLGLLVKGRFLACWAAFLLASVVVSAILALLYPSPFGDFWDAMRLFLALPFWRAFYTFLLGFLALAARLSGTAMWPNKRLERP